MPVLTPSAEYPALRAAAVAGAFAALLAGAGCVEIAGSDFGKHVEREDKHFSVTGKADVVLSTFDGSIEIRPWDKSDVQVTVEKRGWDKEAVDAITIQVSQTGNHVELHVTEPKTSGLGFHFNRSRSAKLIVSVPASSDVAAGSGDGSIDIERISGKLELRSGDGSIRGRQLGGDVRAHTGDGSIKLEDVSGTLDVDTGDGSIVIAGKMAGLRARSGDGSVTIHADPGSSSESDWDITTGDGSVMLEVPEGFGAELDAHTGDGSIRLHDITLSNVTGELGKRTVRGRLGSGGRSMRVRTGDGAITLKRS